MSQATAELGMMLALLLAALGMIGTVAVESLIALYRIGRAKARKGVKAWTNQLQFQM